MGDSRSAKRVATRCGGDCSTVFRTDAPPATTRALLAGSNEGCQLSATPLVGSSRRQLFAPSNSSQAQGSRGQNADIDVSPSPTFTLSPSRLPLPLSGPSPARLETLAQRGTAVVGVVLASAGASWPEHRR